MLIAHGTYMPSCLITICICACMAVGMLLMKEARTDIGWFLQQLMHSASSRQQHVYKSGDDDVCT